MRCILRHDFTSYEEPQDDGGFIQGLYCKKCGYSLPVAKVSKRGAELQQKIEQIRKKGVSVFNSKEFNTYLSELQREIVRL